jgi:L-histidine Nalpha-methyltransferase
MPSRPAIAHSEPTFPRAGMRRRLRAASRLHMEIADGGRTTQLAADVRHGLLAPQKQLPPKYFYDDRGADLFDQICDLPEYYLTRTEQALLEEVVQEIAAIAQPAEIVEFGSGASRKTRLLLEAVLRRGIEPYYVPIDVSQGMLRHSALALLRQYPRLRIHAVAADYEALRTIPRHAHRLVVFLGSTIGNFPPAATVRFLTDVRAQLEPGEHFLLGVDLVKPVAVLEAAYNDRAGITAEFNRNILRVVNSELNGNFNLEHFEHVAFFNRAQSQIEMHLRARSAHTVRIGALSLQVSFHSGETIHTEISRKFTPAEVEAMVRRAGFRLQRWYMPANQYFGLALARAL